MTHSVVLGRDHKSIVVHQLVIYMILLQLIDRKHHHNHHTLFKHTKRNAQLADKYANEQKKKKKE